MRSTAPRSETQIIIMAVILFRLQASKHVIAGENGPSLATTAVAFLSNDSRLARGPLNLVGVVGDPPAEGLWDTGDSGHGDSQPRRLFRELGERSISRG